MRLGRGAHTARPAAGAARAADEERLRELFSAHYGAIARYLRMRGHSAADADDLVAATFEVAWRKLDDVPAGEEALPWLYGVARNQSRNARRSAQRQDAFVEAVSSTTTVSTELGVESREEFAETMAALAKLGEQDRELILLIAWDGLSPADAGQVLGLRAVTARSRLHRARRRLSALLEQDGAPASTTSDATPAAEGSGGTHDV